ncbi:hypothetical protein [Streptomyces sp. NPDC051452]|uniref:hypothetical protein n=1 Tax=Streptomyces sp. NPDC051452 TaxID=3365654 RepID=UPI00378FC62E
MPQHTHASRVCRDCDGQATAAITTGTRNPDGTRTVLTVTCPVCKGNGLTMPAARLARTGR